MEGHRVVDASVKPAIVGSNTQAPTVMMVEKAVDVITGRERYPSTLNGARYERIGPAASHICNGRTSHQRHESPRNPGNTMNRGD
jgi:choline dehydrogenase-like flavoprotein